MKYLLLTITPFFAAEWMPIALSVVGFIVIAVVLLSIPRGNKPSNSKKAAETKTLEHKLPRIPKTDPSFWRGRDSNWVVLYNFCGLAGLIIAIIVFFEKQYMTAVYIVCMGLSAFLAAHILRLLEKGVHHLENLDKRGEQQAKE